ncbi:MAG TPA: signal peptidase II [Longilinea sp.]|nr:signal peptidase II [Longilinea sp.]
MKRILRDYLPLILIASVIILIDQLTKAVIQQNLALQETWMPLSWLAPYARIVHWYNTGVAFGMFQNGNLIFAIIAAIVSVAIFVVYPRIPREERILRIATSMMLAGAIGNLIDRITVGHVTDFISLGSFAVFNVADMSITLGVCILVLGVWLQERRERKQTPLENPPSPSQDGEKIL